MIIAPNSAAGRATLLLGLLVVLTTAALVAARGSDRDNAKDGDRDGEGGPVNDNHGHGNGTEISRNGTASGHRNTVKRTKGKPPINRWTQVAPYDKNNPTEPNIFRFQKTNQSVIIKPALRTADQFMKDMEYQRQNTSSSIMTFKFNINRIRVLSARTYEVPKSCKGIVYWMHRDQRLHDNWALLHAQKLAIQNKVPLHILAFRPQKSEDSNYCRHHRFIIDGLKNIEKECLKMNIQFHFIIGHASKTIPNFVRRHSIGALVVDFSPLRDHLHVTRLLGLAIGSQIPVLQVDAHNVVPCWYTSDHQELSVTTMKKMVEKKFYVFFTEFPPLIKHPFSGDLIAKPTNWTLVDKTIEIDQSVQPVYRLKAGYDIGMHFLNVFIKHGLERYHLDRLNPLINGLSYLSSWLNKGHISAQRVLLEIVKFQRSFPESVSLYKEDLLIRRELTDNYCFYNSKYDHFEGGPYWGRIALNLHRNDTREFVYTREQFEKALTHDDLYNACQIQLIKKGKIHRFLRPYWAKKILEFSETPETAIAIGNYLNNKYAIDANDPNGYAGILWAMTGLHDITTYDRPIFGKIRYMSSIGCTRKFDANAFIAKFSAVPQPNTK